MFIRSLASILIIVVSSFVLVTGQTSDAQKEDAGKPAKPSSGIGSKKLRDLPFPAGIDLQFVIKELARDLGLNVLFDVETFRSGSNRKTYVDLKSVTAGAALDYILLQENLFFEEAGPRTILVAARFQGRSIPQIGVGLTPLTDQLLQYFGVDGGMLISSVGADSPASKAGLKAGDVIVEIDGVSVKGGLGLARAISEKTEGDVILTVVRDRKVQTVSVTPRRGIQSVLKVG